MKVRARSTAVGVFCCCLVLLSGALGADTLVLRDGRRVQGELVSIRDGIIEFDGQAGFRRERLRVDRVEVIRIEFDALERERDFDRDRTGQVVRPGGRPSGLRERDISVDSWTAWKDTGIDVRAGAVVYFSASGRVRWGPNRQDGPEGERNSPRNENRPIPGRPAAALIGRVGDGTDLFFVGDDTGPIRMRSSGRLYLGVNDDFLRDNTGSFRVTVYY